MEKQFTDEELLDIEAENADLYLKSKLNIADMCGLVFTGEIDDDSREPVFIGTDEQRLMYKEAIERENLE